MYLWLIRAMIGFKSLVIQVNSLENGTMKEEEILLLIRRPHFEISKFFREKLFKFRNLRSRVSLAISCFGIDQNRF
jgi:hypothetical protein